MSWDPRTTDEALHRAWREGDPSAADRLVDRYGPGLYNFFASKVAGEADELCRRTLAECAAEAGAVEPSGSPRSLRALLFAAARRQLLGSLGEPGGAPLDPGERSVADLVPDASEMMAAHAHQRRLQLALRQLPLDAQVALELRFWEDLSVAELATVLGVEVSTVAEHLASAQRRLQAQLDAERELTDFTVDALMTEHERRRR